MEAERNQEHDAPQTVYQRNLGPKVRVLFVVTQSEIGGAQQFLARLIERLDRGMFECTVAAGPDGNHALKNLIPSHAAYHALTHLRRNPSLLDDLRSLRELRRLFRHARPDVIFLNGSKAGFNGSIAAALPSRISNATILYRIGGWSFEDPRPAWQHWLYRLLERLSARWKDTIILNNQRDYDLAVHHHVHPRKHLELIHNGIDPYLEFLEPSEARIRLFEAAARNGIQRNEGGQAVLLHAPVLIGVIANYYPAKGLQYFVDAVARLPGSICAVIIGDGPLHASITARISEHGLEKRIILAGRLDAAHRYLRAFSALVLPSLKEGFPWVVLEAMAARVPVVATRVGATPELIESERSGILVPPGDASALASAIQKLLADERLLTQVPLQAHQDLLRRFDVRDMVARYEALLSRPV